MTDPEAPRPTLQEVVYTRLQEDILDGTVAPGEPLRVLHLAQRFGTSQAPIREALRRLTEEGLAETIPYRGTVIREPSWDEIRDIYLLREELEAFAVRRIRTQDRFDLAGVRRAQRDLNRAVRTGDSVAVLHADLEFHRAVVSAAGSRLTLDTWTSLIARQRGARISLERTYPADVATIVPTHQVLIDALETGDPPRAEEAFREHIRAALETFERRHNDRMAATSNG